MDHFWLSKKKYLAHIWITLCKLDQYHIWWLITSHQQPWHRQHKMARSSLSQEWISTACKYKQIYFCISSLWQLLVQPLIKISSEWHLYFSILWNLGFTVSPHQAIMHGHLVQSLHNMHHNWHQQYLRTANISVRELIRTGYLQIYLTILGNICKGVLRAWSLTSCTAAIFCAESMCRNKKNTYAFAKSSTCLTI